MRPTGISAEAMDLLKQMLCYDSSDRASALQCLQHPFLKSTNSKMSSPLKSGFKNLSGIGGFVIDVLNRPAPPVVHVNNHSTDHDFDKFLEQEERDFFDIDSGPLQVKKTGAYQRNRVTLQQQTSSLNQPLPLLSSPYQDNPKPKFMMGNLPPTGKLAKIGGSVLGKETKDYYGVAHTGRD